MAANEGTSYTNFSNVEIGTANGGGGLKIGGTALTATMTEINQAADVSTQGEVVSAANVITAAESGKTFFLNLAGGFTSTLPAPAIGLKYKFVVSTAPTTAYIVTTNASANIIQGMADVNSTLVLAANEDSINFVAATAIVGDWVSVESDGTNWYVTGQSGALGGITFTAA